MTSPQRSTPRVAMLIAALWSACPTKSHRPHSNSLWERRLRLSTQPHMAHLRRIGRVHLDECHSGLLGLIGDERADLGECPRMQRGPLGLTKPYPRTDPRELFEGDAAFGALRLGHLSDHPDRLCRQPKLPLEFGVEAFLRIILAVHAIGV